MARQFTYPDVKSAENILLKLGYRKENIRWYHPNGNYADIVESTGGQGMICFDPRNPHKDVL